MKKYLFFSKKFEETLKKSKIGYTMDRFSRMNYLFSSFVSVVFCLFAFFLWLSRKFPVYIFGLVFITTFFLCFKLINLVPTFSIQSRKASLESDLLYSARHLLLKLESGASLINAIESVSRLKTKSSFYFKELIYDIDLGMPVEEAIRKSIEYSPSKGYTRIMEELSSSLKTGSDIQKTLKETLRDITKQHVIQIQEYGKKLNPMTMFYMIVGTILPSLGTSMLVVATSFLPGMLIIDFRILLSIAVLVLIIQVFFVLFFKSLKPAVME